MRQTDLELYRWKWHNEVYLQFKRVQAAKSQMHLSSYWKEYGAFVSVLPRQTGKTTMLGEIANELLSKEEGVIIVAPTSNVANHIAKLTRVSACSIVEWPRRPALCQTKERHLLVDEFAFVKSIYLHTLLNNNWKSVTMVSTLR